MSSYKLRQNCIVTTWKQFDFAEVIKNLDTYKSENNFIRPSK